MGDQEAPKKKKKKGRRFLRAVLLAGAAAALFTNDKVKAAFSRSQDFEPWDPPDNLTNQSDSSDN